MSNGKYKFLEYIQAKMTGRRVAAMPLTSVSVSTGIQDIGTVEAYALEIMDVRVDMGCRKAIDPKLMEQELQAMSAEFAHMVFGDVRQDAKELLLAIRTLEVEMGPQVYRHTDELRYQVTQMINKMEA